MKGLLVKDFIMIKKHCLMLLPIGLLFFIISAVSQASSMYFAYYSAAIFSMLPITVMAYDEAHKWNKYEILLPIGRTKIVLEKYILLIIFIVPVVLIESIVLAVTCNLSISYTISLISIMLFCGTIAPTVVLPIIFRFGYLKGRIINIIIISTMAVVINVISALNSSEGALVESEFEPSKYSFLIAAAAVILMTVSLLISVKVYKKREF